MLQDVIIPNPEKLEKIKKAIAKDGAEKIHILTDFDRTLTTAFIDGKSVPSLISILRDENYLTPDYADKAHALYAKYHAIEIDPKISFEEKKKMMCEWWTTHFALLVKCGLNKRDIEKAVSSGKVRLRNSFDNFAEILHLHKIPMVILSASGVGTESIYLYLKKVGELYDNTYIISNTFTWDKNDNMIGIKRPIIHSLNKSEIEIHNFPFYKKIKGRKNVLLLGDSLEDIGMVQGFKYDNLIKIGFLNENIENNIDQYKKNYDIVILNDGSMEHINNLLKEIIF